MKRRIVALLMVSMLAVSMLAGCGGGSDSGSQTPAGTEEVKPTETDAPETTEAQAEAQTEASKDGLSFECDTFKVDYIKHEVSKDYEGKPCLLYYFTFTNKGEEATSALVTSYLQFFQNGIELETAITDTASDEINNYMKDIKTGVSLDCCVAISLTDESDVEVEASELISFDNSKATQVITLK